MKKYLSIIVISFFLQQTFAQITVSLAADVNSINPSLLCLNGRSTEGPSWTNNTFLSMVADMNPSYVRYPAGTVGNQFDWRTGTFIPGQGGNTSYPYTIPMLISGLPDGTKIIYMINMVLPTPSTGITFTTTTDAVLSTDATLTAKINDILEALKEFEKNGHLPEVVELGNELYFSNSQEAGVYAGNSTLYLNHAKKIAAAIKNKYPQIKLLICTTKGGTSSRDKWNNAIFDNLSSDAVFKSYIYGTVQHHYINDTYGYTGTVSDVANCKTIISEAAQYVQESISDYNLVPSYLKLWLTEFGVTKRTADAMWCGGLRTAVMALSFMKLGNKIDNLTWHHITDDPNVLNTTYMKLGPSGIVFSELQKAMINKTYYKNLVFSNMNVTDPYATLFGYKFTSSDGEESIVIVNYDNITYTGVNLSGLFAGTNVNYANQYWSATPYVTSVYVGKNISKNTSVDISSYKINPFSITVVKVKSVTTVNLLRDSYTDLRVYPVNFKDKLTVTDNTNDAVKDVQLLDVSGKLIKKYRLNSGETEITIPQLNKGIYLLNVRKGMNQKTAKLIKMES